MIQPPGPSRPPDGMQFNAPPGWPATPPGWAPPPGWRPDPSWPPAPQGWQWWAPTSRPGSWLGRHLLLTAALVVAGLLVLGGLATGVVLLTTRGDGNQQSTPAVRSPGPVPSNPAPAPSPQPSISGPADPSKNIAACGRAAAPHRKTVALMKDFSSEALTNAEVIAAIPPIQTELNVAAGIATSALARDLREYASALGELRTALVQDRDPSSAAAKVLIYGVIVKAECDF